VDVGRNLGIVGALRASGGPSHTPAVQAAETEYLIQDPHHAYATRFIEHLYKTFGLRAVCFYTDRRERLYHQPNFPILRSECVAASYDVGPRDLAGFAAHVAASHNITAVLPFNEPTVAPAVELARILQLDWGQPDVMRRFNDKFTLKDHIRSQHPYLPMNASRRVDRLADVLTARRHPAFERFILKPNNGFGNRNIGLFDSTSSKEAIASFMAALQGTPLVMEQYIEGTEYFVNGQVDDGGNVCVIAIFEYVRLPVNGRHNIDLETLLVHQRDPRFAGLAEYAGQIVRATELRRSPFHLELKVGASGPCLIEVGARLAGHGNAFLCEALHGHRLNLFDLAAHYYLKPHDYGPVPLNWDAYDSHAIRYVHGVADEHGLIFRLEGVQEVEDLPEFFRWVKQPQVAAKLEPTRDLRSMPYSLVLRGDSQQQLAVAAAKVRDILRVNRGVGPGRRGLVTTAFQAKRYSRAARIRLSALSGAPEGVIEIIPREASWRDVARNAHRVLKRAQSSLTRKMQLLNIGPKLGLPVSAPIHLPSADSPERNETVLQWARQYLGRPHSKLGRTGPVCPHVRQAIERDRFKVKYYDNLDGGDVAVLRQIVLQEARTFQQQYPRSAQDGLLSSVVLVFPEITLANFLTLDRLHDELKTHLIVRHGLMCSPFHPRSVKPSVSNSEFHVFRGPLPMFAIRYMDVRDIAFVGANASAFKRYRALFAQLFERGEVSNEFGHVNAYNEARKRFG
jgi:hypothetical protein